MKAIETVYNGYRFRSRLEARWAVFFDTLGIEYEYEREGYQLLHLPGALNGPDRWGFAMWEMGNLQSVQVINYLPDFYIPHLRTWIEIKGTEPTDEETYKCALLSYWLNQDVYLFCGQIPAPNNVGMNAYESAHKIFAGGNGWDCGYSWCQCPICYKYGIEFEGRFRRICRHKDYEGYSRNLPSDSITRALSLSRQARFEFGENEK